MPRKSNKAEAEALKHRLDELEKRLRILIGKLENAVTDNNNISTTVILAQMKEKEKKWCYIGKEYVSKLQTEEAETERERQEDMIDDIIHAKTVAKFSQLKENKEDTSKAILDTVIESLAKLNEKKSDYNEARTYYTTPSLPTLKFPTFTGEYAKAHGGINLTPQSIATQGFPQWTNSTSKI